MKMASRSIDLISKKTNLHMQCSTLFFLISKKTNLPIPHCFARLQCHFVPLKSQTFQLRIIFMEELSYVVTKDFVSCVNVRFCFFTAAHFYLAGCSLLAASISHFFHYHYEKFVSFVFSHSLQLFRCYQRECKHQKYHQ